MKSPVKNELLKRLFAAQGEPVSGQDIADEFGLSRTAIWKYIKELEEEGYEIGSQRKKGYFLIEAPDLVNAANISEYLQTTAYGQQINYFKTVPTTQTIAHEEAQNGAVDGTLIISEEQTAGKGRLARPWVSNAGRGIWMSLIMRPELPPQQAPQLTLVAAVAIVRAIEDVTDIQPVIKWPNDILINGKKVTGILTELQSDPDRVKAIILGIGVNANQETADFPEELQAIATSLRIEKGEKVDRAKLVAKIMHYLEQYTALYVEKGFAPIKILWESYATITGKKIKASMVNETVEGTALGISQDGMLELQLDDGTIRGIYSADIELKN
ncbi:biotin--[acetyl-CoA-carboxylase] ligase [Sporosarcina sp. PTS2304]|uniref:biotin--[acetyl-CoA-carboxylase] ligase n=1 Tax=Sporosarcina sp. PTS2304 TaxID=2283194 RepID=UPI000E0DA7F9|nr:biotin--[acetyl-CoA-carboxylase] ligase [Sporosarcina sp. PTS2304]AXH98884.1 biotin--[acetyl-CoA-carboxylase] ligase [Sporosarcina sp. PTS2304]